MKFEKAAFLDYSTAKNIKDKYGTPTYVYDLDTISKQTEKALNFPNKYGLKVRFAMKACPNAAILQFFHRKGINFDASSGFEVTRYGKYYLSVAMYC